MTGGRKIPACKCIECGIRGCLHGVCGSWCRMGDCADGSMIGGLSAFVCLQGLEQQPADDAAFRHLQGFEWPEIHVRDVSFDLGMNVMCMCEIMCFFFIRC